MIRVKYYLGCAPKGDPSERLNIFKNSFNNYYTSNNYIIQIQTMLAKRTVPKVTEGQVWTPTTEDQRRAAQEAAMKEIMGETV